ncbi:MAG: glutaredoxin family protein [Actinomycetota bacterium]|nr:glutaredoxin family protein [Actinomycetota bacterium]
MRHVTLLTTADCALCEAAKEVLARLGEEHAVEVEVLDVATKRGRELAASSGMAFPPGVLVDGRPFSYGRLSERKLRRELRRQPSEQS